MSGEIDYDDFRVFQQSPVGRRITELARLCPECDGSGEIHFMHRPPDPQTEDSMRCGRCHGTGDWTPDG